MSRPRFPGDGPSLAATAIWCSATSSAARSTLRRCRGRSPRPRQAADIPTGTLHTLFHTAAKLAFTSGGPVHKVASRLGERAETVLSVYAHLLTSSNELAAERVAAALA